VIHLQYGIYEISTIVVLALIFCYARIKSGSLVLPMLLHIINNGGAMGQYLAQVA
jgi:membrane protease YdiL (CAAX protease family)